MWEAREKVGGGFHFVGRSVRARVSWELMRNRTGPLRLSSQSRMKGLGSWRETPGEEDGAGEKEPVGDPIDAMVSGAQELLSQTQDPNLILKSLKGQIQTIFKEPEHALGMVKALYDTHDSILQSVAQRLYLFIKSSR